MSNHMSDKGLVYRIYKERLQLKIKDNKKAHKQIKNGQRKPDYPKKLSGSGMELQGILKP